LLSLAVLAAAAQTVVMVAAVVEQVGIRQLVGFPFHLEVLLL
jgi:hypothetical protein